MEDIEFPCVAKFVRDYCQVNDLDPSEREFLFQYSRFRLGYIQSVVKNQSLGFSHPAIDERKLVILSRLISLKTTGIYNDQVRWLCGRREEMMPMGEPSAPMERDPELVRKVSSQDQLNTREISAQGESHQITVTDASRPPRVRRRPQYRLDAVTQLERRAAEMIEELIHTEEISESEDERTEQEKRVDRANAERREIEKAARLAAFNEREDEIRFTNGLYDAMVERQRRARKY
jgi:hypothetical protein